LFLYYKNKRKRNEADTNNIKMASATYPDGKASPPPYAPHDAPSYQIPYQQQNPQPVYAAQYSKLKRF
jgi:hypothetical protein